MSYRGIVPVGGGGWSLSVGATSVLSADIVNADKMSGRSRKYKIIFSPQKVSGHGFRQHPVTLCLSGPLLPPQKCFTKAVGGGCPGRRASCVLLAARCLAEGLLLPCSSTPVRWCWRKRESSAVSGTVLPAATPLPRGLAGGGSDTAAPQGNPRCGHPRLAGPGAGAAAAGPREAACCRQGVHGTASAPLPCAQGERWPCPCLGGRRE